MNPPSLMKTCEGRWTGLIQSDSLTCWTGPTPSDSPTCWTWTSPIPSDCLTSRIKSALYLQRLDSASTYKMVSSSTLERNSTSPWRTHFVEPRKSLDLLPQPPKAIDLWRIKGEDIDLHLHQADLHFPLRFLRAPCLGFLCANPRLWFHHLCN